MYGLDMVGEFAIFISISAFIFVFIKFGLEVPLFVDLTKTEDKNKYYILSYYKGLQNKIFIPYIFVGILLYLVGVKDIVYLYITGFLMCKISLNTYAIRSLGYQDFFVLFQNGNFTFCPMNSDKTLAMQLIVNNIGRIRVAKDTNGDGIIDDAKGKPISC